VKGDSSALKLVPSEAYRERKNRGGGKRREEPGYWCRRGVSRSFKQRRRPRKQNKTADKKKKEKKARLKLSIRQRKGQETVGRMARSEGRGGRHSDRASQNRRGLKIIEGEA